MALQNCSLLYMFLVMVLDMIPVVSQLKSLVQVISGDGEGARITQDNFTRRCPVVSQLRSLGEAVTGDAEAARQTQLSFVRNVGDMIDVVPGVSQVKTLGQAMAGNEEGAQRTQDNFTKRFPVVSQIRSLGEATIGGDAEAAGETQFEFFRNLGFVNNEKYLYHYTNKQGMEAIKKSKRIKASTYSSSTDDVTFGEGVYFTSMEPDKYSKKEIRRNNYDTSSYFYNQPRFGDKTDYVIRVKFPKNAIKNVGGESRDIYLFVGNYVDLDEYDYDIFKV